MFKENGFFQGKTERYNIQPNKEKKLISSVFESFIRLAKPAVFALSISALAGACSNKDIYITEKIVVTTKDNNSETPDAGFPNEDAGDNNPDEYNETDAGLPETENDLGINTEGPDADIYEPEETDAGFPNEDVGDNNPDEDNEIDTGANDECENCQPCEAPNEEPDTDGDGVNDEEDSCPFEPGSAENNGCPAEF